MTIAIELERRVGELAAILRDPVILQSLLSRDPVLKEELSRLQAETRKQLDHLVSQVEAVGAGVAEKPMSMATNGETSMYTLMIEAKKRETKARERNEAVRIMCLAVMVNSGNPDWNPQDERTYCAPEDSTLLALLEADLGLN